MAYFSFFYYSITLWFKIWNKWDHFSEVKEIFWELKWLEKTFILWKLKVKYWEYIQLFEKLYFPFEVIIKSCILDENLTIKMK